MKRVEVYKNDYGYGPRIRPDITIGDELEIVSDDGVINTHVRVIQVPESKAGGRCVMCSMTYITDEGIKQCLCNAETLRGRPFTRASVCTIRPSSMGEGLGIYSIFKQIGEAMEEL